LFLRGIKGFALFSPFPVQTGCIWLFKKLITCLAIALLTSHIQAQPPLSIGHGSNYYFNNYANFTGTENLTPSTTTHQVDKDTVNHWEGAVLRDYSDTRYNCHAWAWYLMGTKNGSMDAPWPIFIYDHGTCPSCSAGENTPCYAPEVYYNNTQVYVTTDECQASIITYGGTENPPNSPNHSAIHLLDGKYAGMYESKWDEGPLVIHPLTYCRDAGEGSITYYRKSADAGKNQIKASDFAIMGSNLVCISQSLPFTLTCVTCGTPHVSIAALKGIGIAWSCSPNITLPQNINTYPLRVTANTNSSSYPGIGYIQATIFINGSSAIINRYPVMVEAPPKSISSISLDPNQPGPVFYQPIHVQPYTLYWFYGQPFNTNDNHVPNGLDSHWASSYNWSCDTNPYGVWPNGERCANFSFYFTNPGSNCWVTLDAMNACGTTSYRQSVTVSYQYYFSLSPNPASDNVTVTILKRSMTPQTNPGNPLPDSIVQTMSKQSAPEMQTNIPVTYTVKIVNSFGSLLYSSKKSGDSFIIPVGNLGKGNYLVQISDGKTVSSQTLIISR
jgi:hypothetical protein